MSKREIDWTNPAVPGSHRARSKPSDGETHDKAEQKPRSAILKMQDMAPALGSGSVGKGA